MTAPEPSPSPLARSLTLLVCGYQLVVSPWFAPSCRYYPSCSAYGIESLRVHGAFKGIVLTTWRLLRCNPWTRGGVDHVPPKGSWPSDSDRIPRLDSHTQDHVDHDDGAESGPEGRTLGSRTSRKA